MMRLLLNSKSNWIKLINSTKKYHEIKLECLFTENNKEKKKQNEIQNSAWMCGKYIYHQDIYIAYHFWWMMSMIKLESSYTTNRTYLMITFNFVANSLNSQFIELLQCFIHRLLFFVTDCLKVYLTISYKFWSFEIFFFHCKICSDMNYYSIFCKNQNYIYFIILQYDKIDRESK